MKTPRSGARWLMAGFMAASSVAQAHPGHDGHELTWDLGHYTAHPAATLLCGAVLAAAGWVGWLMVRRAAKDRDYNLRGSQASRGK